MIQKLKIKVDKVIFVPHQISQDARIYERRCILNYQTGLIKTYERMCKKKWFKYESIWSELHTTAIASMALLYDDDHDGVDGGIKSKYKRNKNWEKPLSGNGVGECDSVTTEVTKNDDDSKIKSDVTEGDYVMTPNTQAMFVVCNDTISCWYCLHIYKWYASLTILLG